MSMDMMMSFWVADQSGVSAKAGAERADEEILTLAMRAPLQ